MRQAKTSRRPRPFSLEELETVHGLASSGLSQLQIAKAMGRSIGSIAGTVARHKIPTFGGPGGYPAQGRKM